MTDGNQDWTELRRRAQDVVQYQAHEGLATRCESRSHLSVEAPYEMRVAAEFLPSHSRQCNATKCYSTRQRIFLPDTGKKIAILDDEPINQSRSIPQTRMARRLYRSSLHRRYRDFSTGGKKHPHTGNKFETAKTVSQQLFRLQSSETGVTPRGLTQTSRSTGEDFR